MNNPKYWPLDDEPEGEIYDSLAWDLPGYRSDRQVRPKFKRREPKQL